MKKKIFTLLLAVAASIGTMCAESGQCGDYLYWNLNNGILTISGDGQIWDAMDATEYGETYASSWYKYASKIQAIVIPNGVTYIGKYAFQGLYLVRSITIPNSVTKIRYGAFSGCTALTSVVLSENITELEDGLTLGLTQIQDGIFENCKRLTSIVIPNGVTQIGDRSFKGCTSLTSVSLPNSVTRIGVVAFGECTALVSVNLPSSVTSIGDFAFYKCSSLISIAIPHGITSIEKSSFQYCSNLTSVTMPNSLTSIGEFAFAESGLTSVLIPNSATIIKKEAFYTCPNLKRVVFSEGLKIIEQGAFFGSKLTSIILPNSLDSLGWQSFNNNSNHTVDTISLGENLKSGIPYFPFSRVVIWNSINADIEGVPCKYLVIGANVQMLPRSVYKNMTPDTIESFPTYPPSIYPTENVGTSSAIPNTVLHITDSTYISIPCGALNRYLATTGWENYRQNMYERNEVGCTPTIRTFFTVTFKDYDGTVLATQQVEQGFSARAPVNPTRDGYTFIGWDKDFSNVQSNLTVTAQYTPNTPSVTYYTVTFEDWDGTILKSEQVEEGHSATAPANPTRDGYTFTGWDKDFSNVQSNLTVTAQYQKNETPVTNAITVRLKASSATGWSKVNLYYWANGVTSPAWPGITINRDADGWYSHTFDASVTSVNIIWNDGNNQTQDISNVTESTCYSLKSTSGKTIGVNVVECEAAASVSVTGVSLNKKTLQMIVGNTATLTASVLPANASNKSVTWTSSNTATATISSTGTISAKAEGVTTITCQTVDGNFTAECYVVVSEVNSEFTFSYEPTNATVINYTATELSYNEIPENNCVFAILADNAHTLNLMYVGSLVNGVIPQGNYKITSTLQNGTFYYSVGGDDQYDYGSYMATDFDSEGYYTSAYYIIAGDITIGSKNNYTVKVVSANGTDINVTYAETTLDVEIVPSEIKASKILRNGQIYILRGEKIYTITGLEAK